MMSRKKHRCCQLFQGESSEYDLQRINIVMLLSSRHSSKVERESNQWRRASSEYGEMGQLN
ncbi:CLUMA_CG010292, isoform A [Clunio marinus]|uniref:CLUMA_CG010292, isoform A n=1 Tax=Clunio marinus TaxID=568069 RepID=A0A1J1IC43_9DIPT|nr:CLUMA_CG010292, isoform A [Clunio marinus]